MMPKRVAIIGAGMAGLSCADALSAIGHQVVLFDKGRGPGGRMSTRRIETPSGVAAALDHGAQYFTARDPAFIDQVALWSSRGVAHRWPEADPDAWVGTPAMNSVIRDMASGHIVHFAMHIYALHRRSGRWWLDQDEAPFDQIVLAVPAEQAVPLAAMHDLQMATTASRARSLPCWTAMFVFDAPTGILPNILRDHGAISWAARNSSKPGRVAPESWVVQAHAAWTEQNLERAADDVACDLLEALGAASAQKLPAPVSVTAHRWRFALSAGLGIGALWNPDLGLGLCGDWLLGPRVECAWLSGQRLAAMMGSAPLAVHAEETGLELQAGQN